jgi:hypothetical protein
VHLRTLQAAELTGRLATQFRVRSVFRRPIRSASRDAGERFIARHYRCFRGQEICPAPCRPCRATMTSGYETCAVGGP